MDFNVYGPIRADTEVQWQRLKARRWSNIWGYLSVILFLIFFIIFFDIAFKVTLTKEYPYVAISLFSVLALLVGSGGLTMHYSGRELVNMPVGISRIIPLIERVQMYPSLKELLGNYLKVRDYLTREEYDALDCLVSQAEKETNRKTQEKQWKAKKSQLYQ